ncbi:MAG: cupin-like domain-containing protein [Myxococcales bacterium]|nr:cupin-like domain-containing protein [Myxococcales bacterium]
MSTRRATRRSPERRAPRTSPDEVTLSPAWGRWVVDNLLAGAHVDAIVAHLEREGVASKIARREVLSVASSPALAVAREARVEAKRLAMLARMQRDLQRTAPRPHKVARASGLAAEAFFDVYYANNVPVVIEGFAREWPAVARWTPEYFRDELGRYEIEACIGRERDPEYDQNFKAHTERMSMRSFAERVLAAGVSNDLYLIANNRNMERAPMRALYDDVRWDHGLLEPGRLDGCTALWFGPRGTYTPLHHDTTNILFCQIYGRKRVWLAHPSEVALQRGARGVYAAMDPERPRPDDPQPLWKHVELEPGDALFIPVGWWHAVRALSVSINIAFTNFTRDNFFSWFTPAAAR